MQDPDRERPDASPPLAHAESPGRPGAPDVVRFAAAGDLLLSSDPSGRHADRDPAGIFAPLRGILAECDLVLGNLECTFPGDGRTVSTEPRVIARPQAVRAVKDAGFGVVTLANNHLFDCLEEGFHRLRSLLDEIGLAHFGAGDDLDQAASPAIVEVKGIRVAFLGAADQRSGASHFAADGRPGVAPLDADALCERIAQLRRQVNHVIVSPHWGEERFLIPSPRQVEQAHAFVDAGASMVLGHHPHVVQGLEMYRGAPIAYSLGNCVAGNVYFSDGDVMTWDRTERTGCLLLADLTARAVENVRQQPTFDDGIQVRLDASGFGVSDLGVSGFGARRIARANRALARGVTLKRYRREHLWVKTLRPALAHLRWSRLRRLRWRQLQNAFRSLRHARRAE